MSIFKFGISVLWLIINIWTVYLLYPYGKAYTAGDDLMSFIFLFYFIAHLIYIANVLSNIIIKIISFILKKVYG